MDKKELIDVININYENAQKLEIENSQTFAITIRSSLEYAVKLFWYEKLGKIPVWVKNDREEFNLHEALIDDRFSKNFERYAITYMHYIRQECNDVIHNNKKVNIKTAKELIENLEKSISCIETELGCKIIASSNDRALKSIVKPIECLEDCCTENSSQVVNEVRRSFSNIKRLHEMVENDVLDADLLEAKSTINTLNNKIEFVNKKKYVHHNIDGIGEIVSLVNDIIEIKFKDKVKFFKYKESITNGVLTPCDNISFTTNEVKNEPVAAVGNYKWSYEDNLICCREFYNYFILQNDIVEISSVIDKVNKENPQLKKGSIGNKFQNIAAICNEIGIEHNFKRRPMYSYSKANYKAMLEVLKEI